MEHIVQFAIGIDDDAIIGIVKKNAEKVITENIQKEVEKCIFEKTYYDRITGLNYKAEQLLLAWLDSNKDEIIHIASKKLAEKMSRTKAVKSAMIENLLNGGDE